MKSVTVIRITPKYYRPCMNGESAVLCNTPYQLLTSSDPTRCFEAPKGGRGGRRLWQFIGGAVHTLQQFGDTIEWISLQLLSIDFLLL